MKSYTLKLVALTLATAIFSSCERDLETEGITKKITFFPVFELEGEEEIVIHAGDDFTLPGAVAKEQGNEIPVSTSITGTYFAGSVDAIDPMLPDIYNVTYSAVNKDGFPGSTDRVVHVLPPPGDFVNSIEGVYTQTVVRTPGGGPATADYTDVEYAYVAKVGPNTYQLSDGIGGYYDFGREYGPTYAAPGATVVANNIAANDFTIGPAFTVGSFGGVAKMTSFEVNPATKTIKFTTEWDGGPYTFEVTLKQVPL
jgi:hypothetical protein